MRFRGEVLFFFCVVCLLLVIFFLFLFFCFDLRYFNIFEEFVKFRKIIVFCEEVNKVVINEKVDMFKILFII